MTGSLAIVTALTAGQLTVAPTAIAAAGCSTTAPAIGVTVTCNTAGSETITVPTGATAVELQVKGGGGGGGVKGSADGLVGPTGGSGGAGARVDLTISITGVTNLQVAVGGGGAGGVNAASSFGGGGGGASTVSIPGPTYLVVAGGGGGGGRENGGSNGSSGGSGGQVGVSGGGLGGAGGNSAGTGNGGIGGGTANAGSSGFLGVGGLASDGGDGGSGYGGGGSGGYLSGTFGGGGGGGSYVDPTATNSTFTEGGGGMGGLGGYSGSSSGVAGSAGSITLTFFSPPDAPTGVTAAAESGQATVSWTAPSSTGGSAVTSYTVTSNPGSLAFTAAGTATSLTATGLTNGTAYTFTVTATNIAGTSSQSSPSNAVTPLAPPEPVPAPAPTESQSQQASLQPSIITVPPAPVSPPSLIAGQSSALVGGQPASITSTPLPGGGTSVRVAGVVIEAAPQREGDPNPSQGTDGAPQSESTNGYRPGGEVDINITGLAPESKVSAYLYSEPTLLGTLDVDARGSVIGSLPIPSSIATGNHTLQFTGWLPTGGALVVNTLISLTDLQQSMTRSVFFDYGATALRPAAKKKLADLVSQVSTWTDSRSIVVGYQRALGASKADTRRARERANNVARYLRAIGMPGVISVAKNEKTGASDHTARRVTVSVSSP